MATILIYFFYIVFKYFMVFLAGDSKSLSKYRRDYVQWFTTLRLSKIYFKDFYKNFKPETTVY